MILGYVFLDYSQVVSLKQTTSKRMNGIKSYHVLIAFVYAALESVFPTSSLRGFDRVKLMRLIIAERHKQFAKPEL